MSVTMSPPPQPTSASVNGSASPTVVMPVLQRLWVFAIPGIDSAPIQQELTELGFTVTPTPLLEIKNQPAGSEKPTVHWISVETDEPLSKLPDNFANNLNPKNEAILLLGDTEGHRYERLTAEASSNEANRWIQQGDAALVELHTLKAHLPQGFYSLNLATLRAEERPVKLAMLTGRPAPQTTLTITVESFGFRYGTPKEAQWVLDVRFLTNPYYCPELRPYTGQDEVIQAFIASQPAYAAFMDGLKAMVTPAIIAYYGEGKRVIPIAIGCTGGQHRSVMVTNALAKHLETALADQLPSVTITTTHRESHRWPTPTS